MYSGELKNVITVETVTHYIQLSKEAREKATPTAKDELQRENLGKMIRMFDDYLSDSEHFLEQGDLVRAFVAINYAHAWIDCAVRTGLMDGHGDDRLFTLP